MNRWNLEQAKFATNPQTLPFARYENKHVFRLQWGLDKDKCSWGWKLFINSSQPFTFYMKRDISFRKYYCAKTGWQAVLSAGYRCATNASTSRYLLEPTPTLKLAPIIRKVYSGTRQNAGCWRTTQWESPWRRRMKKKPQRWLSSIDYQRCLINHHINCNNFLILAIIVMMMNRCCLLYLHSGCFYCLTIGNSLRVMLRQERILLYSSTTQGGLSYSSYISYPSTTLGDLSFSWYISYSSTTQGGVSYSSYLIHLQFKSNSSFSSSILFKVCDTSHSKSEENQWWRNKWRRCPPSHWNSWH